MNEWDELDKNDPAEDDSYETGLGFQKPPQGVTVLGSDERCLRIQQVIHRLDQIRNNPVRGNLKVRVAIANEETSFPIAHINDILIKDVNGEMVVVLFGEAGDGYAG